jgi:RecB family exonuclease
MNSIVTIRASSLAEIFDCPARWEAKHILGMRMPSSGAATLGTAVHAGTAVFDQSVIDGSGISISEAAGAVVDAIYKPEQDVAWDEDLQPKTAEKIALALHTKYCSEIAPKQKYVGVEVTCERLVITDLGIALTGTTDRIRQLPDGRYGISDLKTGARAVGSDGRASTSGHAAQMGVYELLAEQTLGEVISAPAQIIGMQTAKTTQKVGTGEIEDAKAALIGDEESPGLLEHAANVIHSGMFYPNSKSMLCSKKYCPRWDRCKAHG